MYDLKSRMFPIRVMQGLVHLQVEYREVEGVKDLSMFRLRDFERVHLKVGRYDQ